MIVSDWSLDPSLLKEKDEVNYDKIISSSKASNTNNKATLSSSSFSKKVVAPSNIDVIAQAITPQSVSDFLESFLEKYKDQNENQKKVQSLLSKYGIDCPGAESVEISKDDSDPFLTVITIKKSFF